MINHKQFKSDRRNPGSPKNLNANIKQNIKPLSSGPFRVTDIIKRLKSKYPNKKPHHVLQIQDNNLKCQNHDDK